ncbi:PASTA domain-containing protein [Streptomyces sp. NPDC048508]|uniref:PASTA domain-containing protein n=1 Tax=Streptomyces sp. NPDC048508 TaxID=3365561 RepID=UPI0037121004
MPNWHTTVAAIVTVAALATLGTACKSTTTSGSTPSGAPTASKSEATAAATKTVPNLVGKGLQAAQDQAQAVGFYVLTSHDGLGRDRMQVFDRDWKVCTQKPSSGNNVSVDTKLDFGAVKVDETCPAKNQSAPSAAGGSMPNFKGKSVKAARGALDASTSVKVEDVSGQDRIIILESGWQVCSQTPAPGAQISGQPVTFKAVKFEESCP